jgi:hypothetical protein
MSALAGVDYAAYLHVLQTHDGPDVRRLGNMRACIENMRATCVPSYTDKSDRLFFMFEARSPQQTMRRGNAGAHLSREARSGVTGHVTAQEPTSIGKRGLEPYDT